MGFGRSKKTFLFSPRTKLMKVLAAVGLIGASTLIFIKRDKIKQLAEKVKETLKKAG